MIIKGKVTKGSGRGKQLGYPTANLKYETQEVRGGVYLGRVVNLGDRPLPSLVFVGAAETFNDSTKKIEVYILDFSGDLYGKELEVEIVKKIRDGKRFDSAEELVAQMKRDELEAKSFFEI